MMLSINLFMILGIFYLVMPDYFEDNSNFSLLNSFKAVYAQSGDINNGGIENSEERNNSHIGESNTDAGGFSDRERGAGENNFGFSDREPNNRDSNKKRSDESNNNDKSTFRDEDNAKQKIITVEDKNKCPTQSETIQLNGIINPKGIRLLADFNPCKIVDGSVTLNIPETPIIKLAIMYIDYGGNNHAGTLISPSKLQSIGNTQGLFTIKLDQKMKGINPITGESTTLTKINGLALYNGEDRPMVFESGNTAALTATFTK
jgi:hypothetical protein